MKTMGAVLALFLLVGCPHFVTPVIPIPNDDAQCPAACKHLRDLGCPDGEILADGTTCEKFCSDTQKNGHDLNPGCLAGITTCADQAKCSR